MKAEVPFAASIYLIVILLAISSAGKAQTAIGDENPAALQSQILGLYRAGRYNEAIPLAEKLVATVKRLSGDENRAAATSLNILGVLYQAIGAYAKAEPLLKEALEINEKVLGREDRGTAESLNNLAELYQAMGDYPKAEPLLKEALEIYQHVLGREHPDTATSLNNLAELYEDMGDYPSAEPLLKEALEICQKALGSEHPDTASCLNNLGELYKDMGDYGKAEPLYKEALKIRLKVLGREHPDTALSLDNLAKLYKAMGDYANAEPLYKEALDIRQKILGFDSPATARSLNNLAKLYQAMGDYLKAEPLLENALEIEQKVLGREHPDTERGLENLGLLYLDMGEYAKAEPLLKEALGICQKVFGEQHPTTATSLDNLAALYEEMSDYAKAEPLYTEALQICQKVLGPEHPDTAQSLDNLAVLYVSMGDYAKAEPLSKEALEIYQKVLGREHPDTAKSLNNLAAIYKAMGDYAKAEPLFKEALEIYQKVLGREHPDTATSLNNLAALYMAMGDYAKAEPLLNEALEINRKLLGAEHPLTAQGLNNLAALELDLGKVQEAKRLRQIGYDVDLKSLSQILSFGSEEQRLAYQRNLDPYTLFAALGDSDYSLADAVLHYKGVVLDSIIEDRLLAETGKEAAHRDLVEELNAKKRTVAQLSLQTTTASKEANERIQALEQEVENIEGRLGRQGTDLGQARRALSVRVEGVESALPNDTVLVEYVRYSHYLGKSKFESRYGAVVLSAHVAPRWAALGSAKEIEATLKHYRSLVRNPGDQDEMAAVLEKAYSEVWKSVEQLFPAQTTRVIVSPDGQLNFLSFATLLDPEKEFVAEKYLLQYVTSGRDLLRAPQPPQSDQVVVMANPQFDREIQLVKIDPSLERSRTLRGLEKRDIEDLSFQELGGTEKESAQLLLEFGHWGWKAASLTGADVTKRALLNLHSPYILHLATHGFFEPEDSASETNPNSQFPGIQSDLTKSRFFKNPMHRSGLALAGANTTITDWKRGEAPPVEEDGILTAEDVSALDLKGTWLVSLSACDTGSGEARAGEGVMGLRRGFIQAGAQNLLMTLWPISDEFAVQIMSDFYEAAHTSGNAHEALAKVQRDWLVKLRKEQGLASAVNLAGPFIMSSQGSPDLIAKPSVRASSPLAAVAASPRPSELVAAARRYLDAKDFPKALALFQQAADEGDPNAMQYLGRLNLYGEGVEQDYGQARNWYQKAADAGDAEAMYALGWMYGNGKGVEQDYDKALNWFRKAADDGIADAMCVLGSMYEEGEGVAQDYGEARQWYEKAADAGNLNAMFNLGHLYLKGQGVDQDYGKAHDWFQKSANGGDTDAMGMLGALYHDGTGFAQDYGKALQWFENAADGGNAHAMYNLGTMYREGKGVHQDLRKAREWYQKGADGGDPDAMLLLGAMFQYGDGGARELPKACEWYQKAADAGSAGGMYLLGVMYRDGVGVAKDSGKARELIQKAADAGLELAKQALKSMRSFAVSGRESLVPGSTPLVNRTARTKAKKSLGARQESAANAMYDRGMQYEIDRDYVRAIQCYQQAVALGDADAKGDVMRVRWILGR